jgi:hypothetical protein
VKATDYVSLTAAELRGALARYGTPYMGATIDVALEILGYVREEQAASGGRPVIAPVTFDELSAALRRKGYSTSHVTEIVQGILDDREPWWNLGDIVVDAEKKTWVRVDAGWLGAGYASTYTDSRPVRPLRKIGNTEE